MTRVCIRKPSRPSGLLPSAKSQTRFACFREARLAGQAAIEGLSAPMRLPSAIPHTPKLSECPFEWRDSANAQTTRGNRLLAVSAPLGQI